MQTMSQCLRSLYVHLPQHVLFFLPSVLSQLKSKLRYHVRCCFLLCASNSLGPAISSPCPPCCGSLPAMSDIKLTPSATASPDYIVRLLGDDKFSDMTFVCNDREIKAHKLVVCSQSPVLDTALQSKFQVSILFGKGLFCGTF
jgi:hypothetical protein